MKPARLYLLFLSAALFFSCSQKAPFIDSVSPIIGRIGETITIRGEGFGKEREESYVTIAGTAPTGSSYIGWQDDSISLKLPGFGESGLIYVHVRGRRSNGVLFLNQSVLPRPVYSNSTGMEPQIISVEPQSGAPGSLITITGNNFGGSREQGGVFFSWRAEEAGGAKDSEFIEVSEAAFGYELWSDREIRARVPDGAASGSMEVRNSRGGSLPFYFEVSGRPGTKSFKDKRRYTISYSVDIKTGEASKPNTLYLWVPLPESSPSQRNVTLVSRNVEPFVENHQGTAIFKFDDMANNSSAKVQLSYTVEVYIQETTVRPQSIKIDAASPEALAYTQSSALILSDDPEIKSQAAAVTGRERSPYIKARQIYEWFLAQPGQQDACAFTLRFCAMLRAAGVPCIPVAGVLVNRSRQTMLHYWAEFWIDGLGWIPVDPAMAAGMVPAAFTFRQNQSTYYFGSLDNQRIAFSRGEANLSRMDPRGRPISRTRSYSLQNLWEEAIGGIESYSSLWGDITITGIYVN